MANHPVALPPPQFTHGEIRRWRRVPGLVLAEVQYAPHQRVPFHSHANARFVLVLRGTIAETTGSTAVTHTAHTLLFRCAQQRHAYRVGPAGAQCLIVDADAAWLQRAEKQAPLLTASTVLKGGLVMHLAQRLYGEFRLRDEVSRLAIESLALGVLAEASRRVTRAAQAPPAWLLRARAFVDAHFTERLALSAVAALVGVHRVHLARSFRRAYHTTFAAYVRTARLEFATRALTATELPLSEIAVAAGFCDQSHFTRLFKRHTGMSPQEYRLAAFG
jgi:AraC family transcriptional regulator